MTLPFQVFKKAVANVIEAYDYGAITEEWRDIFIKNLQAQTEFPTPLHKPLTLQDWEAKEKELEPLKKEAGLT